MQGLEHQLKLWCCFARTCRFILHRRDMPRHVPTIKNCIYVSGTKSALAALSLPELKNAVAALSKTYSNSLKPCILLDIKSNRLKKSINAATPQTNQIGRAS